MPSKIQIIRLSSLYFLRSTWDSSGTLKVILIYDSSATSPTDHTKNQKFRDKAWEQYMYLVRRISFSLSLSPVSTSFWLMLALICDINNIKLHSTFGNISLFIEKSTLINTEVDYPPVPWWFHGPQFLIPEQ